MYAYVQLSAAALTRNNNGYTNKYIHMRIRKVVKGYQFLIINHAIDERTFT